ncbi:hypothetical protein A3A76_00760 [Candidatus Woesebacteria bacterium RIFCSPLOWO2_01_FULL_39_23]|uniref:Uncharacterized protein n=1 Tax=Candidatus Woesebacteria bacterium RIFCSPHIGHO2_01_FULL_40_22 TaxID=1802499 RepID=A0A1F7YHG4_9BACT|nr:MAG: hypothetical protein A2141_05405 [Candidatus Woesebacteria bacterium RBG_16_40_11]OGM26776.1 MAG: hypothetical protein A2628_04435 [Candidatus Woesebacteria bacterium RIFCSPHIGHO2_01_FULL_40_22]OGM37889.1 MAG: hypothetical protein A3E41_01065 [Candidatus Woesebacteria bacterium RIFCSPHIGHO2_12_FULL_38_9]OGM63072.1 MAG: hypothetical protein A3A76_00760 [Candidatus Woesebacteria bacterium RIFCSPLOWO2_01_FULL_39_23]
MSEIKKERLGELPVDYRIHIPNIKTGGNFGPIEDSRKILESWAGDNPYRRNQLEADLKSVFDPEPQGRGTNPITPTSTGTGLSREEKRPRDLRESD